ncbi:MAG: hypothetical protein Q8K87_06075 [Hydrogenophaga sp.]|nr:hypothetical protein [Hydrogenophaga sp.]MDP3925804.1 hypothetical protein [Hydrogenophaga sp.]
MSSMRPTAPSSSTEPRQASTRRSLALTLLSAALLGGCAAPKFTVDDGRAVDPTLLANIGLYGQGEQALRPAIARSARLKDNDCDRQWELPISVATSQGWSENDRVAWVRALGVDERLTVVAATHDAPLKPGERLVNIDGSTSNEAQKLLVELGAMRERGRPFPVTTSTGKTVQLNPFQVCRGYTRLAPPNTPELQDYHWLMSYHPLELAKADLTEDEALWTVLWTQGVSEEGGARMKVYDYGTSLLSTLYTVATLASGLKGAAMAAEAAVKTAQQAAASVATELLKQQLIDQAKTFAANRLKDEIGKSVQALTQAQVVASMQQVAANRGLLGGISRVAATVFDDADAWAYTRMEQLGANPLAGFTLHQKLLERNLLTNALAFDPERMASMQALTNQAGRGEEVVAILKGIRPETLNFDLADMPLASAQQAFSYEDLEPRSTNPYARGLIEAMLEMPDTGLPAAASSR